MSDNKFFLRLKGTQTPKSVVEVKNDKLIAPFTNVPNSTDVVGSIIDDKDSSVVVAKGAQNWKLDGSSLVVASSLSGDGSDYTGEFNVSGNGLWINAVYSLPATIFAAGTKWALKFCGKNLLTTSGQTIGFTLVVKIGNTHITSKTFTVAEGANVFCRQFVIDFSESEQAIIKAQSGDSLTVQLLCSDTNASATIYNGMTVFTALQRRVDGDAVASDTKTFEELEEISDAHISNKNNPHKVTKAQIGLGNCDNTSDLDKPISTATQNALDRKVSKSGDTMTGDLSFQYNTNNPVLRIIQSGQNTNHLRFINNNSASQSISFDLTQAAIHPLVTGRGHLGTSSIHFGDAYIDTIYTGAINNGYDISVPVTAAADSFALESEIADINGKIPAQASSTNQLADKNFVNSSIATNTADFKGTYNSLVDLEAVTADNNDYGFVVSTDSAGNTVYARYKYNGTSWVFEYNLNNSSFTSNQWATINSGATSNDVSLARSSLQPGDVGNGTITITQGGVTKGSFTLNQSSGDTIALDAGGGTEVEWATYGTTTYQQISDWLTAGKDVLCIYNGKTYRYGYDSAGHWFVCVNPGAVNLVYVQTNNTWSSSQRLKQDQMQYSTMPTANLSNEGKILQYVGTTDADYTNGYFYVCVNNGGVYSWQQIDVQPVDSHRVIAFQAPTAQNNYTWYRKYADGWIEMGGQTNDSTDGAITITLPVQLADANYVPLITGFYITDTGLATNQGASKAAGCFSDRTTTSFKLWKQGAVPYGWEIKWMAQA